MASSFEQSTTKTPKKQKIRTVIRNAVEQDWTGANVVPDKGELIYASDVNTLKIGDGITSYNNLPAISGGGSGGTTDYTNLINKPQIDGVILVGNKTAADLGFANVATSGSYTDLTDKPTIPAAQQQVDWNASSGITSILNKPTLSAVATSGDYTDLSNKPTINDLTTADQQAALNSGATSENIDLITYNTLRLDDIQLMIPSYSNHIADTDIHVTAAQKTAWSNKQNALVSGTNIKTINNTSLLGSGNLNIDSLPDQSGNAGKVLTTDGTAASWSDTVVVDRATTNSNTSIVINKTGDSGTKPAKECVVLGVTAFTASAAEHSVAIGYNASTNHSRCVSINGSATNRNSVAINGTTWGLGSIAINGYADSARSTALGYRTKTTASHAIQLGASTTDDYVTNPDANTFKVANANGNFEMMDANGNVPLERLTYVTNQIGDISTALTAILGE